MNLKSISGDRRESLYGSLIRCVITGDSPSGKTTFAHALLQEPIANYYSPTFMSDTKNIILDYNNSNIKLQVIDLAGNERYRRFTCRMFRGAALIFYMLDLANESQLASIPAHLRDIKENSSGEIPIILVGNIPSNNNLRSISAETAKEVVTQNLIMMYVELNIYNHDEVRKLLLLSLSKIFFKDKDDSINDISQINILTAEQQINSELPLYTKVYNNINDCFDSIIKINNLITRSTLNPINNSKCYSAKLILMRNIFSHENLFSDLEKLPNLFLEYMDAIGGNLRHLGKLTENMIVDHLSLLIRFFDRLNNNPHYQGEIINKIDDFYRNTANQYFPIDNIFHPLVTCKLLAWMKNKPVIAHFNAFQLLPFSGENRGLINHIINQLILNIRSFYIDKFKDFEESISNYVQAVQKYYSIQKTLLSPNSIELQDLILIELRVLQNALPPVNLEESKLWINLKYLESAFQLTPAHLKYRFLDDLTALKICDETDDEYYYRRALASFLIRDFTKVSQIEMSYIKILKQKSFGYSLKKFSIIKKDHALYTQMSVDILTEFMQLSHAKISIATEQKKQVSIAALHLIKSAHLLEVDSDSDFEDLAILLAEFSLNNCDIGKLMACIQKLMIIENELARSVCGHIIAYYMAPIKENESHDAYLERLSAAVSLFAIYEPLKPHYYSRMILLINAEEIIQRGVAGYNLTEKDFHIQYGNLAASPEKSLLEFIASRQDAYLNALCRCYRQTASMIIKPSMLVKQYIVVMLSRLAISSDNCKLISNILEEQITFEEFSLLIQDLLDDQLKILAEHHLSSILTGFYKNASELCTHQSSRSSFRALSLLFDCVNPGSDLYVNYLVPQLSKIVFKILTDSLPAFDTAYLYQGMQVVSTFIKHGANLFYRQIIGEGDNLSPTHTILALLKSKHHNILISLFELYRNNPQDIIDNGVNDYIDQNPLLLAISNNGNRQLVTLMLQLGFSTEVVYAYLAEEHDPKIMEEAKKITSNTEALHQLCLFSHKKLISLAIADTNTAIPMTNTNAGFYK